MEENQNFKQYNQKLKKYIQKSIFSKELVQCSALMSRKKLDFFYEQMQQHLYQQNLKKLNKERRFSLGNEKVINLDEKKYIKIDTQPEFMRRNKKTKIKSILQQKNKEKIHQIVTGTINKQKIVQKRPLQAEINYFVRKVKNSKVVRYINLKPSQEQLKKTLQMKTPKEKKNMKALQFSHNSNFQERNSLLTNIKSSIGKKFRNSCIQL